MILSEDEATYVLAYLMAGADGHVTADEESAIDDRMSRADVDIDPPRLRELRAFAAGAFHDTAPVLESLSTTLKSEADRVRAITLATDIMWADREIDPGEMTGVFELADELDLPRDVISDMLDQRTG